MANECCPHPVAAHSQHGCRVNGCRCARSKYIDERVPEVAPVLPQVADDGSTVAAVIAVAAFVAGLIGFAIGVNL